MNKPIFYCSRLCISVLLVALLSGMAFPHTVYAQALNVPKQVTPNFPDFTFVIEAAASPDGKFIVFLADLDTNAKFELYSVPVDGSGADVVRLNVPLVKDGDVGAFKISPDSKTVVYQGDAFGDSAEELFSVPIEGGDSIRLNPPLVPGPLSDRGVAFNFFIDNSGQQVVYRLDLQTRNRFQIFRVPIQGGTSVLMHEAATSSLALSPDGETIVFASERRAGGILELYSMPLSGTVEDAVRLHAPLTSTQDAFSFKFTPDNTQVVFSLTRDHGGTFRQEELHIAAVDGSDSGTMKPLVNGYPINTGDIDEFEITPNGKHIVYISDQRVNSLNELFRVPLDGGDATRLSDDMPTGGFVREFVISPTGDRVVYQADGFVDNIETLFSVPITSPVIEVTPIEPVVDSVNAISGFVISGDGKNVIYDKHFEADNTLQLFLAPVLGGKPPVKIGPALDDTLQHEEGELRVFNNGIDMVYIAPNGRQIFHAKIARAEDNSELCLPIRAKNGRVAVVCL